MKPNTTWVVIVVKDFARAKSRLGAALDEEARVVLARSLFDRALRAARKCPEATRILVATDSDEVAAQVQSDGLACVMDGSARGLAAIVDQALDELRRRDGTHALVTMSDLPGVTAEDLSAMLQALADHDVALAPDHRLAGTNAMATRLQPAWPTCFGHADSLARHRAQCEDLGLDYAVVRRPGLALDVDRPDDLVGL